MGSFCEDPSQCSSASVVRRWSSGQASFLASSSFMFNRSTFKVQGSRVGLTWGVLVIAIWQIVVTAHLIACVHGPFLNDSQTHYKMICSSSILLAVSWLPKSAGSAGEQLREQCGGYLHVIPMRLLMKLPRVAQAAHAHGESRGHHDSRHVPLPYSSSQDVICKFGY